MSEVNYMFIGIDVGNNGGVSYIKRDKTDKEVIKSTTMDFNILRDILHEADFLRQSGWRVIIGVESVHAMPKQGVVSMFSFGKSYGYILGSLAQLNLKVELITPQKWKKHFLLLGKDKKESVVCCKKLFDGINLYRTVRCRTESDGMAESLLIAKYMYNTHET